MRTTFAGPGAGIGVLSGSVGFSETAASNSGDSARLGRHRQRLRQELVVRAAVATLIFVFDHIFDLSTGRGPNPVVRIEALLGLALNLPYYALGRTNKWPRAQAYVRMLVDIVMITIGLGSAGGLEAAGFLAVYTIVPLYCGLVFSSAACSVATAVSTGCYIALVGMQHAGWLPLSTIAPSGNAGMAAFNLLIVNVVGVLTSALSEAYRRSRQRQVTLNRELERANDQAQLLNAEIQRAAQLRVLGEVVAGVTHELANVLTVASGHLGLVRKKAENLPDVSANLLHVEESFDAAMRIIRNTLQTARQPASGPVLVSVPDIARRVMELKAYDVRRDGITVHVDFPARFPEVRCLPFQLQQVLLNLVTNAQHALREVVRPREIHIVGLIAADNVIIEVSDTGPGIPSQTLPRVFEPFYTTKRNGTGLGLAISAYIIQTLRGRIAYHKDTERGASFSVSIPRTAPAPAAVVGD